MSDNSCQIVLQQIKQMSLRKGEIASKVDTGMLSDNNCVQGFRTNCGIISH